MTESNAGPSRVTLVWLALITATAVSWQLGHHMGLNDREMSGVVILVIAVVKVRYVMLDFMELRYSPLPMRLAIEIWAVIAAVAMAAMYRHC